MRKLYTRFYESGLRMLLFCQRLSGEQFPATPWVLWVRFHKAEIERHNGIRSVHDQLKFFTIGLMLEDSIRRQVSPPNNHQYRALVAEIDATAEPDPIAIITKAVKIHYGIVHEASQPEIKLFENKLRKGLTSAWT